MTHKTKLSIISIRESEDKLAIYRKLAEQEGLTLSEWVRKNLREQVDNETDSDSDSDQPIESDAQVLKRLKARYRTLKDYV